MSYTNLASEEVLGKTVEGLKGKGYNVIVAANKDEAMGKIKELIPAGASVMNGASTTLEQIGYINYLKEGKRGWNNLHEGIVNEKDPVKQSELRKLAVLSDFYLGSVHALVENGEFLIASNSGSQLPHSAYTSPNLIYVVSTKKIVPNLTEAMNRLETHVIPLEDARMKSVYGYGTTLNKILISKGDASYLKRKVNFILVKEDLGF